ncbi:unnamed protein product, partial [Staurois parvus]
ASVVRQAGSISIGQVGTGGASGEWSGSQARDQEQENGQTSQGSEQGQQRIRQEQETGPRRNTHQGPVCRSECPLNTPV